MKKIAADNNYRLLKMANDPVYYMYLDQARRDGWYKIDGQTGVEAYYRNRDTKDELSETGLVAMYRDNV